MKVKGLDYVFYNVSDLKRSLDFYQNILGLKLYKPVNDTWAELDLGNMILALGVFGAINDPKVEKNAVSMAISVEDVAGLVENLKKSGVKVLQETMEFDPCFMAIIEDPDRNQIILHHRKDGTIG
ncbi:MAG: VOC family protein [Patescibacteria group bacterium]